MLSDINILMDLYGCWSGGTSLAEGVRRAGLEFTCYLRRISIWYLNKLYVILLEDIILLLFFYIASCTINKFILCPDFSFQPFSFLVYFLLLFLFTSLIPEWPGLSHWSKLPIMVKQAQYLPRMNQERRKCKSCFNISKFNTEDTTLKNATSDFDHCEFFDALWALSSIIAWKERTVFTQAWRINWYPDLLPIKGSDM